MTEITRVPILPIKKGSLTRLWLGLAAVLLVGAGLAWATVPTGLSVDELQAGVGPTPQDGDVVFIHYKGTLPDGTVFDESQDLPLPIPGILPPGTPMLLQEGALIPGFIEGLKQMQKGGKYELYIPAEKAYGANPQPGSPIPPNSPLIFEIELVDFMSEADATQKVQMMQQLMQQQQGAPEAPLGE